MKVCLIGNYAKGQNLFDGQRSKTRLYYELLIKEGCEVELIDLFNFKRHFVRVLLNIRKQIKKCDVIVLMAANRGTTYLMPYINKINKKYKKRFVIPLIGTSVLHNTLDKLTQDQCVDFIQNKNYSLLKPSNRLVKNLKMVNVILPETERISEIFRGYYGLTNVHTLTNFRDCKPTNFKDRSKKAVYLSRVMEEKGIFDLLKAFSSIKTDWELDIYGPIDLNENDRKRFFDEINKNKNINYMGIVSQDKSVEILRNYSLFVFPTRFVSEGTPGVIVESLIAGTPVLTSSFMQADQILKNGIDSVFYELFNLSDLIKKLSSIMQNNDLLNFISMNTLESRKTYEYSYNRKNFLLYLLGKE